MNEMLVIHDNMALLSDTIDTVRYCNLMNVAVLVLWIYVVMSYGNIVYYIIGGVPTVEDQDLNNIQF